MQRYGHYGLTLIFATPIIVIAPFYYSVPIVGMMLIATLFPNKEVSAGFLGRRGFTHTIWFAILSGIFIFTLVAGLLWMVSTGISEISPVTPTVFQPVTTGTVLGVGTSLGMMSHIIGDMVTTGHSKPVIRPFAPVYRGAVAFNFIGHRHPLGNETLLKFMVPVTILLYMVKLGVTPIYFS